MTRVFGLTAADSAAFVILGMSAGLDRKPVGVAKFKLEKLMIKVVVGHSKPWW
jgi:hypothetical protein